MKVEINCPHIKTVNMADKLVSPDRLHVAMSPITITEWISFNRISRSCKDSAECCDGIISRMYIWSIFFLLT